MTRLADPKLDHLRSQDLRQTSVTERTLWVRDLIASGRARALRLDAGLSLADAGRDVEVGPDSILRWERGEHAPRGRNVTAYYAFLRRLVAVDQRREGEPLHEQSPT